MKPTQTLPSEYELYENVCIDKWKKTRAIQFIFGIILAWLSYNIIHSIVLSLRPEYQPPTPHFPGLSLNLLIIIFRIAAPVLILISIHEFIHTLILYFYTGQWPKVKASLDGISIRTPQWYIPRNQFLFINLAPVFILGISGLFLIPFVSQSYLSLLIFLFTISIGASYADITSSLYLFLHSPSSYLKTSGVIFVNRSLENDVPKLKKNIRISVESFIAKLDPLDESG